MLIDSLKLNNHVIQILVNEIDIPSIWLWKWSKEDYGKSLEFEIDECRVDFYFLMDELLKDGKLRDRQWPMKGKIVITIERPDGTFLDGLKNQTGKNSQLVAERIYNIYDLTTQKVVLFSR